MKSTSAWALSLALALFVPAVSVPATFAEDTDNVTNVTLGKTIDRSWDEVKADNFAYGPKQDYDARTGQTHVYLPYGNDTSLYAEVKGDLEDTSRHGPATFRSAPGSATAQLTFKLRFSKPIASFRYQDNQIEFSLAPGAVGGVEYSVDGQTWTTMKQTRRSAQYDSFGAGFQAQGLHTDTLFIRYYTRNPKAPDSGAPGRALALRLSGDPNWGDAAWTFFASQLQVWVTPAGSAHEAIRH